MGLNETQSAERINIGFFGARNAGKSSLVNVITNQHVAVVSDVAGTTTDAVRKSMELAPLGPVMIIDTPGFDDVGSLGEKRILETKKILATSDIAVLVVDAIKGIGSTEKELTDIFIEKGIPYIIAYNKSDMLVKVPEAADNEIYVSALFDRNIEELKNKIGKFYKNDKQIRFVADFVKQGDVVVLVVPIDESAPKGRLILPQQQAIRDILDAGGQALVVKDDGLEDALQRMSEKPSLVITDSQVFEFVDSVTPEDIPLTSFSILMARYKGFLDMAVKGAQVIGTIEDGDKVLICEGCTHHRQCNDIGTVKLPNMLRKTTGKDITFEFTSGRDFPEKLEGYKLIIHCGGCMLNDKEVRNRMEKAVNQGVPVTNYGTSIAYVKGILERSIAPVYNLYKQ